MNENDKLYLNMKFESNAYHFVQCIQLLLRHVYKRVRPKDPDDILINQFLFQCPRLNYNTIFVN